MFRVCRGLTGKIPSTIMMQALNSGPCTLQHNNSSSFDKKTEAVCHHRSSWGAEARLHDVQASGGTSASAACQEPIQQLNLRQYHYLLELPYRCTKGTQNHNIANYLGPYSRISANRVGTSCLETLLLHPQSMKP